MDKCAKQKRLKAICDKPEQPVLKALSDGALLDDELAPDMCMLSDGVLDFLEADGVALNADDVAGSGSDQDVVISCVSRVRKANGGKVAAAGAAEASIDAPSSGSTDDSGSDDGHVVIAGAPLQPFRWRSEDLPRYVEGVEIGENAFGAEGDRRQRYHRLWVRCPCSGDKHGGLYPCRKRRNLVLGSSTAARLEVVAYLAVWLRRRHDFQDRHDHISYGPTRAEVNEYMREKRWG